MSWQAGTADQNETTYAYNDYAYDDLVTSSTNPMNQVTGYSYDADGRLTLTSEPNGDNIAVGYDVDGNKCSQAPVNASIGCGASAPTGTGASTYTYDGANELVQMQDNNGTTGAPPPTTYTYTEGMMTSVSDDNGNTVSYLYGRGGEVLCIAYPSAVSSTCGTINHRATPGALNLIVNYGYDTGLRTTSVTAWTGTAGSNSITYGYTDSHNPTDVTSITYPTTTTNENLTYAYDKAGNLKSAAYAGPVLNGESDNFTYNADEQLSTTSLLGGTTTPAVVYNDEKQIISAENPGQGSADTYNVNANGEITEDQGPSGTTSYGYNADGAVCWNYSGVSSNACNSAPTGATSYSYDANGQRTGSSNSSTNTYTSNGWNAFGQLCWESDAASSGSCGSPPTGATQFGYAGNGLRISQTNSAGTTKDYTWDIVRGGTTPLDISDGKYYYIYGPLLFGGTAPIEQIKASNSDTDFLASIQSGVQDVFSSSSTEKERATYSLYGEPSIASGFSNATAFGFQGSYTDSDGLIYLINRYYDPSTDQFLSIDPDVMETGQPYVFTGDDPLNSTDPLGLSCRGHRCPKPKLKPKTKGKPQRRMVASSPYGRASYTYDAPPWCPEVEPRR